MPKSQVITCAFRRTPVAGRKALYFIACTAPTRVRLHQSGRDLFNNVVMRKGIAIITPETADPVEIAAWGEDGGLLHSSSVTPLVIPPTICSVRVTMFPQAGGELVVAVKSDGTSLAVQLIKDRMIEERHSSAGSDRFIFRPMQAGKHVIKVISNYLTASTTETRLRRVGATKPKIWVEEIQSGKPGDLVSFSWETQHGETAWIEGHGQRTPVGLQDSIRLRVPDEARLIIEGSGGSAFKMLRAIPWFLHTMVEGDRHDTAGTSLLRGNSQSLRLGEGLPASRAGKDDQ
jgi:hypothetical protein